MTQVWKVVKRGTDAKGQPLLKSAIMQGSFCRRYDGRVVRRCLAFDNLVDAIQWMNMFPGQEIWEAECVEATPVSCLAYENSIKMIKCFAKNINLFFTGNPWSVNKMPAPSGTVRCKNLSLVRRVTANGDANGN